MTDQPEALRLAGALEHGTYLLTVERNATAAELRRLHDQLSQYKAARFGYASEFPPDAEGYPDIGNIHANIRAMKARIVALENAARMALDVLAQWDALIVHPYTGSSAAMTDMHYAAQHTLPVMNALREALK